VAARHREGDVAHRRGGTTMSDQGDVVAIRATYMRGGTSKGMFFAAEDLPGGILQRPSMRDALLMRMIGSPDPYGRHTDGMGGATSSTSKVVIVSRSLREDCDVDFLFGAVSIEEALIDWSGNCGNLTSAVGPFAIARGWVTPADRDPTRVTITTVRIWQQNIGKRIVAHVPVRGGQVVETGTFSEDGVPFGAAEIRLEFIDPADAGERGLLPTGNPCDALHVPELEEFIPADGRTPAGTIRATLINAGNPTVFVRAESLRLTGRELPDAVNRDPKLLARLEAVRARAAVAMGLARNADEATRNRPATPKIAFVAAPAAYRNSAGVDIDKQGIDVLARIVSMGKLHHAFTGTGSIALAVAAALPGTIVSEVTRTLPGVPTRIGHVSGVLAVGAVLDQRDGRWHVERAVMSRSARRLMDGMAYLPMPSPHR
jgi:probable AcnD-accessory protein PrpF